MRPSTAPGQGHRRRAAPVTAAKISGGMANLAVIEAANPEMEALSIAVAMREARHLDKSAALVTPDRALARRGMAAPGRPHPPVGDFRRAGPDGDAAGNFAPSRGRTEANTGGATARAAPPMRS